ncbi:Helicase loader DnaI [Clostridiaceae bacterium JG1575]|nr:Helicase loader DnaI [Clostridiaceae bacterium JG1575]
MTNLHAKVMKRYESLRQNAEALARSNQALIYETIPRIAVLEDEMRRQSLACARAILKKPEEAAREIERMKRSNLDLRQEKAELLVAHGHPADFMEPHYQCPLCQDSGYLGLKKCPCYSRRMAEIILETSDFKDLMVNSTFFHFNESLFDDEAKDPSYNKTARANMKNNLSLAKKYVREFKNHTENLYFYGPAGTGKTFLASCIAHELVKRGFLVIYRTAAQLMEDLKQVIFQGNQERKDLLLTCDLLIIDDLGTEMPTDLSRTELFNLINQRLLHQKKMIISANLGLEHVRDQYSERLASRIMGDFLLMPFFGQDLRLKKGQRQSKAFRRDLIQR